MEFIGANIKQFFSFVVSISLRKLAVVEVTLLNPFHGKHF